MAIVLGGMGTTGASGLDESGLTEVSNQRGEPVAGATVMAYRNPSPAKVKSMSPGDVYEAEPEFVAVTDSAGLVDLPELPDRRRDYSLVVVGDGLVTESMYIDELDSDGAQLAWAGSRNRIQVRTTRRAARLAQRCHTSTRESRKLIDKDNVPAEVGRVFSRTSDARVDFLWSVGNTLSLGVGVRHDNGRVSGGASTMRTIDNTVEASFPRCGPRASGCSGSRSSTSTGRSRPRSCVPATPGRR